MTDDDSGYKVGEPTKRAFEQHPGLFQPSDHDGKWRCTGCDYEYEERAHAATCCIAPGRPPDFDTAIAVMEDDDDE